MTKEERYEELLPRAQALLEGEDDLIARMANLAALLHSEFGFWWTGFYRVAGDVLVLGPFQGPVACTRIPFGKGVDPRRQRDIPVTGLGQLHHFPAHVPADSAE